MKLYRIIISIIFLFISSDIKAQFYVNGDDPGNKHWYQIQTDRFQIIYPEGTDSLARVYARNLEKYKIPVSRTAGYVPGEKNFFNAKMPVVLHTYNAYSNGSVAWAPKRMDLYTIPSAYSPEAIPWHKMLTIHESRHITQMQFGLDKGFKAGDYIFGEMFNILASLLYTSIEYMEGDAVITETALTKSGRGRRGDFLNYYMLCFDQGIKRSWDQWRQTSQKYYIPNYYALGYLTLGGFRYRWDNADIMEQFYKMIMRQPYRIHGMEHKMSQISGMKFKKCFNEICDTVHTLWRGDADARKPYIHGEQVTRTPYRYTNYSNFILIGEKIYAVKKGFLNSGTLVEITRDGNEKIISKFASETSVPHQSHENGKVYWSETIPDKRWSLKADSRIRYIDISKNKRKKDLSKTGWLYNPNPSEEGKIIAATEYLVNGKSRLAIMDAETGERIEEFSVPDTLQLMETVWHDKRIYASALSDNGYGIYSLEIGKSAKHIWRKVLGPEPTLLAHLSRQGNDLTFCSDRSGVTEFYHYNTLTGQVRQKTSTRYGIIQGQYSPDLKYLYYTSITLDGSMIFRTPVDSLLDKPVIYGNLHKFHIAEKLTQQEKEKAEKRGERDINESEVKISSPKRYRKIPHMFNIHSWAPIYADVKNIMNLSFDHIYDLASLGMTGIFQNHLSTSYGSFGYSAHKDPYNRAKWRHSGHFNFTYSGLYPVFELDFDINDRAALQSRSLAFYDGRNSIYSVNTYESDKPYVKASLKTYIPFNFSSGGWNRGVIPQITYTISNDMFDSRTAYFSNKTPDVTNYTEGTFIGYDKKGKNWITNNLRISARGYSVLNTPNSCVYPQWGIGAEIGASFDLNKMDYYVPMGYAYLYGYLPGIVPQQGIRLSAVYQRTFIKNSRNMSLGLPIVNTLPRGLSGRSDILYDLSLDHRNMAKFTIDYGIPVYIGAINVGSFLSIKRLELNPHFDFMVSDGKTNLFSAGISAIFQINSIFWLSWPCSIGVTYSYNGGSLFHTYKDSTPLSHHFVGPVFNVVF